MSDKAVADENYADILRKALSIGQSFDVLERNIEVGGRNVSIFFVDGLVDGSVMPVVMSYLLNITDRDAKRAKTAKEFIKINLPYLDALAESKMEMIIKHVYSGLIAVAVEGIDDAVIVDIRSYPSRGVEEPAKEKSLRGAKDGFTENFMTNIALIRRRIRDPRLVFKAHVIGKTTKTDVSLVYMKGEADEKLVNELNEKLNQIFAEDISVGDQTIVELLLKRDKRQKCFFRWINPFPKVRYTQRPDVAAAHLSEGKIVIIVDNSPTVILLPTGIFDFMQDVDDYYFPLLTGNYFRLIRFVNFVAILLLIPIYFLMAEGEIPVHDSINFFVPKEDFAIPLFWQFILLEIAVDGLKLASLNTPDSLGMSLSVIGALILGQFSVDSGWFIPQTILCMAVVALASFTLPSIELGYGIKFMRILILAGAAIFGIWGASTAMLLAVLFIGSTKTLVGTSYLYPLFPFNRNAMKHLLFRTKR